MRRVLGFPGALALALLLASAAAAAPRLALRGWPGAERTGEALFESALRAPSDSVALAAALGRAIAALQAGGWIDARASARWDDAAEPALAVDVVPGVRYRWGDLAIDAPHEDSLAYAASLHWRPGGPADPDELTAALERAVAEAESQGHAWAQLGVSDWRADSARVSVRLTGTRGPQVVVRELRFEGLQVTRPELAEKAMGRLRGLPYNPATSRAATQRLEQLGVFRRVEFLGLAGAGDWRQGVLRWRVEEPRYNTFEGAVGVQGSAGVVGLARLELGNLLGTARAMTLTWQSRGRGLTDFGARYTEPMLLGQPVRLEAALAQQIQDTLFSRFRWGARARVAVGASERIEAGFEEERVVQARGEVQSANLQNTLFALEYDGRDESLSPRHGLRARVSATQVFKHEVLRATAATPAAGRTGSASALEVESEWHRPLGANTGLAFETHSAGRFSSQRVLAEWERYPLGGATTLRGHDEEAFRVDRYALGRLEWRYFLGTSGQRLQLFWDHAEMQTRLADVAGGDHLRRASADGVGFGMRVPAAGGVVDLDYGLEPGHGFLDGRIHLRLVTAF